MNNKRNQRRGIILLVVLGMLAFLSVLVVTYVVFTSRSRQSAFAIANSEYRQPMHREMIDNAMMKLLRGTNDSSDAFFGEDLLSDVYGRTGAIRIAGKPYDTITALPPSAFGGEGRGRGVLSVGGNFVKIPYSFSGISLSALAGSELAIDDFLTGRVITFDEGPLKDHSFRVLRSIGDRDPTPPEGYAARFSLFIELDPNLRVVFDDGSEAKIGDLLGPEPPVGPYAVASLFYGTNDVPYQIRLGAAPLNGMGIGFDGESLNLTSNIGTLVLPLSFQPKGLSDKDSRYAVFGDFDEPYDAPDFQNYFLAYRYTDEQGNPQVIPSFHRPALINYLANEYDLDSISESELRQLIIAIERATFRPIPWARLDAITSGPVPLPARSASNPRFTGGNTNFALRSPNYIQNPSSHIARLDQLLQALIQGPWDVDNDGDGVPDSVWVDLGLPLISSPDGKLLRPMVAALIEDTGGRLHINAHGNLAQLNSYNNYTNPIIAPWGGVNPNDDTPGLPYRGLGYGPAEIFLATTGEINSSIGLFTGNNREALLRGRYQQGTSPLPLFPASGDRGHDLLDRLLTGTRPGIQTWASGWGFSQDPWGRGGVGVSRSGRLYAGVSGTRLQGSDTSTTPPQPRIDETINDPYETDPRGELAGDSLYTLAEFNALMRNIDWDRDMLPDRLRNQLAGSLSDNPELYRLLTTRSVSLDLPPAIRAAGDRAFGFNTPVALTTVLMARLGLPFSTPTERQAARANFPALLGPELLLGRKLDVNRPLGNGIDDNGNGVIDEPREVHETNPDDPNATPGVPSLEQQNRAAFAHVKNNAPARTQSTFGNAAPDYNFGVNDSNGWPVSGRQLLARNLYVLMMAFSGEGYEFPMRDSSKMDPASKVAEYRARKLAQWAVNVVDYRDQDAIMTYFPYDPTPFDEGGWEPTEFVWGVESPELVFQESLALHDVRVKDTTLESANAGKRKGPDPEEDDPNTDSIRIPQGSLLLELYNPRARIDTGSNDARNEIAPVAAPPKELYTYDPGTNQYLLDLARMAPPRQDDDGNPVGPNMPVWRIAITKRHYEDAPPYDASPDGAYPANEAPEQSDPEVTRLTFPDTASFELAAPEELGVNDAPERLGIDRVVFFQNFPTVADSANVVNELTDVSRPQQVFFNILGSSAGLLPEQYLVLAPRTTSHLGSQEYPPTGPPSAPSQQKFEIATTAAYTGMFHTNTDGILTTPNTNVQTQPALPLVIAAAGDHLAAVNGGTWTSSVANINNKLPQGVGLNVSEPLPGASYYPEPNFQLDSSNDAAFPLTDAYVDYDDTSDNEVKDNPVDLRANAPILELTQIRTGDDEPAEPFLGTAERFCTAYLQRLADPTLPYQNDPTLPNYNPYRSVDWISIDLTVFSGEERESKVDPPVDPEYAGGSRQRNGQDGDGSGGGILYSYQTADLPPAVMADPQPNPPVYFSYDFRGLVNPDTGEYELANARQTFNHLNAGFGEPILGPNRGQPPVPFALHEWLNRPFATPYEVMMVPATSQGRLFQEFTTALTAKPYETGTPGPAATSLAEFKAPFGHLLNFFQAHESEDEASQFYRVFDYIDTRPPFRGELQAVNPVRLRTSSEPPYSGMNLNPYVATARDQFVNLFQPPFNIFSDNRREGEINLNTVADYGVWMGLMYGHLTSAERAAGPNAGTFKQFRTNRRGYPLPTNNVPPSRAVDDSGSPRARPYNYAPYSLDPRFPTEFAGVYRPAAVAGLAPAVRAGADRLRRSSDSGQFSPVDGGLLRQEVDPATAVALEDPMFVRSGPGEAWRNRDRNAFFRYQTLMRMPNLVTEQSHVYLVRMTLGYFEVDASTLATGAEYKADLGQNERYQATYMIDRSVPVAYEPGVDRNVRNTILYQRVAE